MGLSGPLINIYIYIHMFFPQTLLSLVLSIKSLKNWGTTISAGELSLFSYDFAG